MLICPLSGSQYIFVLYCGNVYIIIDLEIRWLIPHNSGNYNCLLAWEHRGSRRGIINEPFKSVWIDYLAMCSELSRDRSTMRSATIKHKASLAVAASF